MLIKDFSSWIEYDGASEGSGRSEKIWLVNPSYDPNLLYDEEKGEYYSLEMILNSLQEYDFQKDFLKISLFDFLIGNTDRHQNNWAILQKDESIRLCPLYDNGSSLCCYIQESKIDSYLGNDKVRFKSLVDSKSTSRIRIDKNVKKEPTHLKVLEFLKDNYYKDVINTVKTISCNVSEKNIDAILEAYTNMMSEKRKILIKKFLIEKVNLMLKQFNL